MTLNLVNHPVQLRQLFFPSFHFERLPDAESPFEFPELDVKAEHRLDLENRQAVLVLTLSGEPKAEAKNYPLSFSVSVVAFFDSPDFPDVNQALDEFIHSASALNVVWPYVRNFLSNMNTHLGLPEYHIPLVIGWENVETVTNENIVDGKAVDEVVESNT
jgi:preprotein translocase subunit SecB